MDQQVDFNFFAFSVFGYVGCISAPYEATLKEESHALQCTSAGHCSVTPTDSYERDPCAVSEETYVGSVSSVKLPIFRTAASSGTLFNGLAEVRAAREYDGAAIYTHTAEREAKFLNTSMAFSTMKACEYVRQIDLTGGIAGGRHDLAL